MPVSPPAFEGKTALVTGGAQGIGRAIAQRLVEGGAAVVVADVDEPACRDVERVLNALGPGTVKAHACDVGEADQLAALFDHVRAHHATLDALVNNAGIGHNRPIAELALEDWMRVLSVTLTAGYLCAKHASATLSAGAGGAIVNIASTRALMSEPNSEAYAAAKSGVLGLTHALAISLGPAVRVNCISPGWIDTSRHQRSDRQREPKLEPNDHAQHPVGRVGTPEDIANLAAFLLSDDAGFITGQNFIVDGGMVKKMIYE